MRPRKLVNNPKPPVFCPRSTMSQPRADHTSAARGLAYSFALATLALITSVPATGLRRKSRLPGLKGHGAAVEPYRLHPVLPNARAAVRSIAAQDPPATL